jgi:hypothetical protein
MVHAHARTVASFVTSGCHVAQFYINRVLQVRAWASRLANNDRDDAAGGYGVGSRAACFRQFTVDAGLSPYYALWPRLRFPRICT